MYIFHETKRHLNFLFKKTSRIYKIKCNIWRGAGAARKINEALRLMGIDGSIILNHKSKELYMQR